MQINAGMGSRGRNVSLHVLIAVNAKSYRKMLGIREAAKEDTAG